MDSELRRLEQLAKHGDLAAKIQLIQYKLRLGHYVRFEIFNLLHEIPDNAELWRLALLAADAAGYRYINLKFTATREYIDDHGNIEDIDTNTHSSYLVSDVSLVANKLILIGSVIDLNYISNWLASGMTDAGRMGSPEWEIEVSNVTCAGCAGVIQDRCTNCLAFLCDNCAKWTVSLNYQHDRIDKLCIQCAPPLPPGL